MTCMDTTPTADPFAAFPAHGDLAYMDTFSGLIPCRVDAVDDDGAHVTVTADRGAYRKGEAFHIIARYVVPRRAVKVRGGRYVIVGYAR